MELGSANRAYIPLIAGDQERVDQILTPLEQSSKDRPLFVEFLIAEVRRDQQRLVAAGRRAAESGDYITMWQLVGEQASWRSQWPELLEDPGFQHLLRDVGLDDESLAEIKIPQFDFARAGGS